MPVQKCPMCLRVKDVVSSHLIPAALYDYCRTKTDKPVRVGDGVIMYTDRQVRDYLLCLQCEDLLNSGGESWTTSKFATSRAVFPLYDLVTSSPPLWKDGNEALYSVSNNPHIDRDKLAHFALGIFWKASVHPWKNSKSAPLIELGPYSDAIRRWLRRETDFPRNICLTIRVSRPENAAVVLLAPVETRAFSWHTFWFKAPGVVFTLETGKQIAPEMRECCFYASPLNPIFVSDELTQQVWKKLHRDFSDSRKSKGYLQGRARRAKVGGTA